MKRILSISMLYMSVMVLLSGCASLNSDFECPLQKGVGCKSVDEVNDMIDRGEWQVSVR